ncbi:aldehyde dehydrogenase family protein [Sciscionella marina]|uniref:aldehyde dehydrogenase family protein n=1 Tax=Sciscionella marina TaxID=508770 RepID=UPI00035F979C|nr:aldehyde dehydrogenase family protein [Sciscionella marina]
MSFAVLNPSTEQVIRSIELASAEEADAAIAKAHEAWPAWRELAPGRRAELLRAFADEVDADLENLAGLEVANSGHTIGNARGEAGNVRDVLRYYAAAPERLCGKQIPVAGGLDVTFHEPLGVVGVIVPWNFPMPVAGWGFAPALAAGNTVVLKPAENTPLTALRLAELAARAGIPSGVFTVLPGLGDVVGQRFVDNPVVRKVVFTGSTRTGKRVMAGAANSIKRVTLELGGKNSNIVFADADLERAAAAAPYGVFDNAGQDCCARSNILVERSAYERFLELMEPVVRGFAVGDPARESTEMGPLISAAHRDKVRGYVDGAPVAYTGSAPQGPGFWFPPTVLAPIAADHPAVTEEVFGPVVSVLPFDTEAEAITLANNTEYGLSGSLWTRDLGKGIRVSRGVRAGNLSVNSHSAVRYHTPFGGFGQSGIGRELGPDAAEEFTETKNVFISTEE